MNVINTNHLHDLLKNYILDMESPKANYDLGIYYENIGQTASALSFFLRCAERSEDVNLQYECLIRSAQCFNKQGKRNFTVKGLLQHAISLCPKNPEAYYLLSRFYEKDNKDGHWQDSYMIASIGEQLVSLDHSNAINGINYPGRYSITFQKALAAWWCGLIEESRDIFLKLLHEEQYMLPEFVQCSVNNLLTMQTKPFINFKKSEHNLKFNFDNSDIISENYSEAFQDIFVLTLLNGKKNGSYLEIGSGDPFYGNNTFLLENKFEWKGISIDINQNTVNHYNSFRLNKSFTADATTVDYAHLLQKNNFPTTIDYLQIDCDPPENSYKTLLNVPFDKYSFSIITYEHDFYCDRTSSFQQKSSDYLEDLGYVKLIKNIAPDNHRNYEDWWINTSIFSNFNCDLIKDTSDSTKNSKNIFIEPKHKACNPIS